MAGMAHGLWMEDGVRRFRILEDNVDSDPNSRTTAVVMTLRQNDTLTLSQGEDQNIDLSLRQLSALASIWFSIMAGRDVGRCS